MVRLVAAAALSAAGWAVPAHAAPGVLAGTGTASTLSCASGPIAIEGVNGAASIWTFHISTENHSAIGCADATSTVITGTWSPSSGGTIATATGTLTLSAVPTPGIAIPASISVCFVVTPVCYSGSVTVTRF